MGTEATAFEYAMGLFSVLIGLAVVDVATSFHRLARVRLSIIVGPAHSHRGALHSLHGGLYVVRPLGRPSLRSRAPFFVYLSLVALFFVLYLAAAASLPDEATATTNLRAYYEGNRRYFWTLVAIFQALYTAFGFFLFFTANEASGNDFEPGRPWVAAALLTLMTLPTVISAALIFLKSRAAHYSGVAMLIALMLIHYAQAKIG